MFLVATYFHMSASSPYFNLNDNNGFSKLTIEQINVEDISKEQVLFYYNSILKDLSKSNKSLVEVANNLGDNDKDLNLHTALLLIKEQASNIDMTQINSNTKLYVVCCSQLNLSSSRKLYCWLGWCDCKC